MRGSLVCLGLTLAVAACTSPSEPVSRDVTLTPTASVYAPGALISATLANASDVAFTYAACHPHVERLEWPRWILAAEDPRLCAGILRTIAPRSTSMVTVQLPAGLPADTYRLRLDIRTSVGNRLQIVRSPRFSVAQPD